MSKIASYDLNDKNYEKIRKIYRIRGYEILLIGGTKHILILEFKNGTFRKIGVIEDVHTGELTDICMIGNVIYSKGFNEAVICCTHLKRPNSNFVKSKIVTPVKKPQPLPQESNLSADSTENSPNQLS